ncbi:hypothetical protein NIES267_46770 [Calothrix parasitica NIES-267]|uniref:Uncharacterized protein n=1 Tax=Calothrix parasitica NIES-267 TaxID=1973488 RepID=A0A1Z4LVQ6_9CYAN|nr:hypothetical protein NIES267_46770 [Calothrix parasitica NIES-267]
MTNKIWQKILILIPIPQKQYSIKSSVDIDISFDNNSIFPCYFNPAKSCFPEIISSHGQVFKSNLADNTLRNYIQTNWLTRRYLTITQLLKDINYNLIPAKDGISIAITAKIFWQDNKLNIEFYLYESHYNLLGLHIKPYCSIENLIPEKYRFRFNYLHRTKISNRKPRPVATTYKSFYLVNPSKSNPNAVEIDGIQFETILSPTSIIIPGKEENIETSVDIGMKITNQTLTAFEFDFFDTLIFQIIKIDGQTIRKDASSNALQSPQERHYPLVKPGESITFFPNTKLLWFNNELCLKTAIESGGFYYFYNLQPGEYLIRFVYRKKNNFVKMRSNRNTGDYIKPLQWLDRTIIATPFVKLYLLKSDK